MSGSPARSDQDRSRRLSARNDPAERGEVVGNLRCQPFGGARGHQDVDGQELLASRPKVGSWVEPKEHWNLLDRDVLSWYVTSPNREHFLRTVQEFRHIIEPEATALAAERRTEDQMSEISQALHDMGSAASLQQRTQADTRFHVAILRASGNDLLVPLGVLIKSALNQLFIHVTREGSSLLHAQKLHEKIEKCIRLQQPNAARNTVRNLLTNTDKLIGQGSS